MKRELDGFLKFKRQTGELRPVKERVVDYKPVYIPRKVEQSREQSLRCMNCGTPFCHWACPLANYIPEWNCLASLEQWEQAFLLLENTNPFPEITGRVCPALCEYSCVLGIEDEPVTIRENELAIIEYAFKQGWVRPKIPVKRGNKKIAVIGSGPAGLAAADRLSQLGHKVVVFEQAAKPGGILRYGIPDFKLEKRILDRRIDLWKQQGIEFIVNTTVDKEFFLKNVYRGFNAVCLCGGAREPRDLDIPGRSLDNIYFAMDYLTRANKEVSGEKCQDREMSAKGRRVVVIGGGDTGSDCVGTAHRQGAVSVTQIELMPEPPVCRGPDCAWPKYPVLLRTTSSHEEGGRRLWSVMTKEFTGSNNKVSGLNCVKVEFKRLEQTGSCKILPVSGSEFGIPADMVIIAAGFLHPEHKGLLGDCGFGLDLRGNVETNAEFMTGMDRVFSCGDMRQGQSLVVRALLDGRAAAESIDRFLGKK